MKTRFQNQDIAHVWANQTDAELAAGREGHANSMSFSGPVFRSYQTEIARLLINKKNERAFLVDASKYSVTTTAHQSRVHQAIGTGALVWSLPFGKRGQSLRFTGAELFEHAKTLCADHIERAAKARNVAPCVASAQAAVSMANEVREFFGLRNKPFAPDFADLLEKAKAENAKRAEFEKNKDRLQSEFSLKNAPRFMTLWRTHQEQSDEFRGMQARAAKLGMSYVRVSHLIRGDSPFFEGNCALRLSLDGERVETNRGAQVLVRTVKFLWAFCRHARSNSESVAPETVARMPRLDHYNVNAIDAGGNLKAGCHSVAFCEIEYIARELGLPPFNGAPCETPSIPAEINSL